MKNGYKENIGFVEEQLVLELTGIGIGTCWLGTYNDKKIRGILNALHVVDI
jgi:nitroreductase